MSKALDMVSHAGLISKLSQFNINGSLLSWFSARYHSRCDFLLKTSAFWNTTREHTVPDSFPPVCE